MLAMVIGWRAKLEEGFWEDAYGLWLYILACGVSIIRKLHPPTPYRTHPVFARSNHSLPSCLSCTTLKPTILSRWKTALS